MFYAVLLSLLSVTPKLLFSDNKFGYFCPSLVVDVYTAKVWELGTFILPQVFLYQAKYVVIYITIYNCKQPIVLKGLLC